MDGQSFTAISMPGPNHYLVLPMVCTVLVTAWYKWRYGCPNVVVLSIKLYTLIAWLDVMKCSWSAITWVLEGLEKTILASIGRSLYAMKGG